MSERNIFAVCDLDVDYAYHFMEYLSKKKNIPFEVRVFTSAAGFREYVKEHPVELLLISEKAMNSEIREAKIGQILILSDGVVSKGYEEYPSIYKYQSSNQVIREALEHYGEGVGTTAQTLKLEKKKMEVIGVYSPVGRTMKTTFALTLGQILAKKRACLYLNLEACSGFEYLLERSFDQTLGDLLYYQRLGSEQLITKMGSIVQSVNNLDYLPPVLSMEDIQSTTAQEWISLLQQIIDYSNYDVVILDLSDSVSFIKYWNSVPESICRSGQIRFRRRRFISLSTHCRSGRNRWCWIGSERLNFPITAAPKPGSDIWMIWYGVNWVIM